MEDFQYYPTPESLSRKVWAKFKNRKFTRVLDPSAGEGHLLAPLVEMYLYRWDKTVPIDCVEIDITRHPILQSKRFNVVGIDFMQFSGAALYSHIVLNPPFAEGVKHTLKAWDILFDGELVAILNAETIRNPFSAERRMLVNLIEQHGSVEYLQDEFLVPDAERKTPVEIALVHLEKVSNFEMDFLSGLEVDSMTSSGLAGGFKELNEIAVHEGMIDNSVRAFNAAVKAAREQVFATAKARYYSGLLGETMESLQSKDSNQSRQAAKANLETVRKEMQELYDNLKNRAWTGILRSTQVTSRLSSKAQQRLEAEFENVKKLDFSVQNIYGFILGLINKTSDINLEMCLDVFDSVTKYHSENRCYFMGWRSNDAHRRAAFRIKTTRFIIPGHADDGWRSSPDWDTTRFLADFDKVFAMLDGKREPEVSLQWAFAEHYARLKQGERISTSYFDVRYFPGRGTIHFFPTSQELMDRLNRLVGRHRQWLPPEGEKVPDAFWLQYDKAEKFSADLEKEIAQVNSGRSWWDHIDGNLDAMEDSKREKAVASLNECIGKVLRKHGIDPAALIENQEPQQAMLPLLAA